VDENWAEIKTVWIRFALSQNFRLALLRIPHTLVQ